MSKRIIKIKQIIGKIPNSKVQSLAPTLFVIIVVFLFVAVRANADPTNLFTGCLSTTGHSALYNAALGTSPTAPCKTGDPQVSADYGDITSVSRNGIIRRSNAGRRYIIP